MEEQLWSETVSDWQRSKATVPASSSQDVDWKNTHNIRAESYVFLVGIVSPSNPGRQLLKRPGESCSEEAGEESSHIEFCSKEQVLWTTKYYCWLRKTRYFKEFSTFLCMRRCKGLGLLKSFLLYASQLLIWKDPGAGKDWRQEEKGTTEDEMVGGHHQLDGREFG